MSKKDLLVIVPQCKTTELLPEVKIGFYLCVATCHTNAMVKFNDSNVFKGKRAESPKKFETVLFIVSLKKDHYYIKRTLARFLSVSFNFSGGFFVLSLHVYSASSLWPSPILARRVHLHGYPFLSPSKALTGLL